jgi:hypothetical protein
MNKKTLYISLGVGAVIVLGVVVYLVTRGQNIKKSEVAANSSKSTTITKGNYFG